jgi:hypothetical protein
MEWIGPVLQTLIGKLDPVTLVLLVLLGGCAYYHIIWRREDREDKGKLLEALNHNTEALSSLKNIISAATGKPL